MNIFAKEELMSYRAGVVGAAGFAGVELARAIILESRVKFAVIGGQIGRADAAGKALESTSHGSRCVLALDGYNYKKRQIEAALDITSPDIVLVCYGSPKQEIFIDNIRDKFKKTLFLGLGGSVDIYSGAKRRAPEFIRKIRLEWLYRMVCEPRRFSGIIKILGFLLFVRKAKKYQRRIKNPGILSKNARKRGYN